MKAPYPFQQQAIDLGTRRNIFINDEPGLGKTLQAIEIALRRQHARRFLVVAPSRTMLQWEREILDQDPAADIFHLYHGMSPKYVTRAQGIYGWFLTYYEAITSMATSLADLTWDVVIVDEAHRIKNKDTQWTKTIKQLPTVRKIALTGTEMEQSPADLWSIVNWLYPSTFRSYWGWRNKYVEEYRFGPKRMYRKIKGPKNLDKLAMVLNKFHVRRTKKEVAPELPPRIVQRRLVEFKGAQRTNYDRIKDADDVLVYVDGEPELIENVLAEIVRLQRITSVVKTDWVLDWLKDHKEPVIIFTKFRSTAELIASFTGADLIIGGVQDPAPNFIAGKKDIVVGTIAAMGEGIDGLQRADVSIFVDQEWSTTKMYQAFDRIHRLGIDSPKAIYMLECENSVDQLVLEALEKKWTTIELVRNAIRDHASA